MRFSLTNSSCTPPSTESTRRSATRTAVLRASFLAFSAHVWGRVCCINLFVHLSRNNSNLTYKSANLPVALISPNKHKIIGNLPKRGMVKPVNFALSMNLCNTCFWGVQLQDVSCTPD
jgi:hypothetical protein